MQSAVLRALRRSFAGVDKRMLDLSRKDASRKQQGGHPAADGHAFARPVLERARPRVHIPLRTWVGAALASDAKTGKRRETLCHRLQAVAMDCFVGGGWLKRNRGQEPWPLLFYGCLVADLDLFGK
jgi:hypothetical protein